MYPCESLLVRRLLTATGRVKGAAVPRSFYVYHSGRRKFCHIGRHVVMRSPAAQRCQRLHFCTRSLTSLAGTDGHQTSHSPERCVTRAILNRSARGHSATLADLCPKLTESMRVLLPVARRSRTSKAFQSSTAHSADSLEKRHLVFAGPGQALLRQDQLAFLQGTLSSPSQKVSSTVKPRTGIGLSMAATLVPRNTVRPKGAGDSDQSSSRTYCGKKGSQNTGFGVTAIFRGTSSAEPTSQQV